MMRAVKIAAILLMYATLSWAGETGSSRSASEVADSSGHGTKHSASPVFSMQDIARVNYPSKASEQAGGVSNLRKLRPARILLTMPRNFDREGVYVWRDSVGVWNIRCISRNQLSLTGKVVASGGIQPVDPKDDVLKLSKSGMVLINQSVAPGETPRPLEFKATGNYVDFNLLIDGKNDPNRIYLGSRGFRPQFVPFRLENRLVVVLKESAKSDAYRTRRLPQARVHEGGTAPQSDALLPAPNGGGSAGGAGERKVRK